MNTPVSMSHMEFRHFISDSLTFAFLIPTWRLAGAFSSSLTTHGIQPAQHEAVWSLPPQGDSEGPNLHQLHSTAITWTYLRSPGSSVRGTPTCPTILGDSARSALVSVQPVKTIETVRVWAYSPRKSSPSWPPTSVSCPPRLLIPVGPRTDRDLRFSRLSGLAARKAPQLQTLTFPGEPAVDGGQRHHIQLCRDRVAEVMRKDRSRTTTGVVTMPPGELTQLVHARGLIRSRRRPVPGFRRLRHCLGLARRQSYVRVWLDPNLTAIPYVGSASRGNEPRDDLDDEHAVRQEPVTSVRRCLPQTSWTPTWTRASSLTLSSATSPTAGCSSAWPRPCTSPTARRCSARATPGPAARSTWPGSRCWPSSPAESRPRRHLWRWWTTPTFPSISRGRTATPPATCPRSWQPWVMCSARMPPRAGSAVAIDPSDPRVEQLARHEHERWLRRKVKTGWSYGDLRDDARRLHPCVCPWEELPEQERDKDRLIVVELPKIVEAAGMTMARVDELGELKIGVTGHRVLAEPEKVVAGIEAALAGTRRLIRAAR